MRTRSLDALAGLLGFAVAAAFAELIAAIVMVVSPHVAVGDVVIRLAPASAVHFATSTFGTNDKPALLGVIVLITLAYGALIGIAARTRPDLTTFGFALWWAVCAAAVWLDQTSIGAAGVAGWALHSAGASRAFHQPTRLPAGRPSRTSCERGGVRHPAAAP